jgi:hypothetical protein
MHKHRTALGQRGSDERVRIHRIRFGSHTMKITTAILATSAIDRHGECLSEGALQGMVDQINTRWITVGIEHDPRIAPVGRIRGANLVRREGEIAVEGKIELYEPGDKIPLDVSRGEREIDRYEPGEVVVQYDRTYRTPEGGADVAELAKLLNARAVEESKKAFDPVSVLLIGLKLFAAGFLKKFGEDTYSALKERLKASFSRAKPQSQDRLLIFRCTFEKEGVSGVAEVILTNPSSEEIDSFLSGGLAQLSNSIQSTFDPTLGMRELNYEYRNGNLELKFAVRLDGVPLFPTR